MLCYITCYKGRFVEVWDLYKVLKAERYPLMETSINEHSSSIRLLLRRSKAHGYGCSAGYLFIYLFIYFRMAISAKSVESVLDKCRVT